MKKYAKKSIIGVFILFLMMIIGFSLVSKSIVKAANRVTVSNVVVNDLAKEVDGSTFNVEVTFELSVASEDLLTSTDIQSIGLVGYMGMKDPTDPSLIGIDIYAMDGGCSLNTSWFNYKLYSTTSTETFVFDYSQLLGVSCGKCSLYLAVNREGYPKIEAYLGDVYVKEYVMGDNFKIKDIAPSCVCGIAKYIDTEILNEYCEGFSATGTGEMDDILITDSVGNSIVLTNPKVIDSMTCLYCRYYNANTFVFVNENNKIIGMIAADSEGNLPVLPAEYKTSESYYNRVSSNKYLIGLFSVSTGLAYYNAKYNAIRTTSLGTTILYPRYRAPQFSIVYHNDYSTNGLSTYSVERLLCDEDLTLDENKFEREGYIFIGWSTSPDSSEVVYEDKETVVFHTEEQGVVDLYPVWQGKYFTFKVNKGNGTAPEAYLIRAGEAIDINLTVSKSGYTLMGWSPEVPETMPTNNVTISAIWQKNSYDICFYIEEGGELYKKFTFLYGTRLSSNIIDEPSRVGYIFDGWSESIPLLMPAGTVNIYAKWKKVSSTLIFDSGTPDFKIDSITAEYGDKITAPELPTRVGYLFDKWEPAIPETMPAEGFICYACWLEVSYMVTCKLNNGENDKYYEFGVNAPITGIEEPTKYNCKFIGWDKEIPEYATENIELTALWEDKKYCIKINDADDVDYIEYFYSYNQKIDIPNPNRYHYDFAGYSDVIPETMPDHDIEVTALWTTHKYMITFDTDGGSLIDPLYVQYKAKPVISVNPTKEGYTFVSWDKEIPTKMENDIELKAVWEKNSYKITFVVLGVTYKEETIKYDEKITIPENPTSVGYTFVKWNTEIPAKMPANDLIITAVLDKVPCTVFFHHYDGSIYQQVQYYYGDLIEAIEAPLKENYTFNGWYIKISLDESEMYDFEAPITNDINMYPHYVEGDKLNSISITSEGYKITIEAKNGIYNTITFTGRVVTSETIDQYDFTKDFYFDYPKLMFFNSSNNNNRTVGAIYTIVANKDGKDYQYFDLPATITLEISDTIKDKKLIVGYVNSNNEVVEFDNVEIKNNTVKFTTSVITEYVIGYSVDEVAPKQEGCNSKIFEIFGLVAMTATALFIIRKRFGGK